MTDYWNLDSAAPVTCDYKANPFSIVIQERLSSKFELWTLGIRYAPFVSPLEAKLKPLSWHDTALQNAHFQCKLALF